MVLIEPTIDRLDPPERRRVGFYVHHQGRGHLQRALAIIDHLDCPATVLTSRRVHPEDLSGSVEVVRLPPDVDAAISADPNGYDTEAGGGLHWAPLAPGLLGPRIRALVDWMVDADPAALVSDVSVEAALIARLCGVPTVVVRECGVRGDDPHLLAFRIASAVLAPYPPSFEAPTTPAGVIARTQYTGMITRAAPAMPTRRRARRLLGVASDRPMAAVVIGAGGTGCTARALDAIAAALPQWQIVAVGPPPAGGSSVRHLGWVPDIGPVLAAADVVVGSAGAGLVAEVARARRPLVCVAENRPFDEQRVRAEALERLGAGVVVADWDDEHAWRQAIVRAHSRGADRLAALHDTQSAARAAAIVAEVADRTLRA